MQPIYTPKWLQSFKEEAANLARQGQKALVRESERGREVYTSPSIPRTLNDQVFYLQWIVTDFAGEFNVFFVKKHGSKMTMDFNCAFHCKETALQHAIKSVLIASGYLTRHGLKNKQNQYA